MKKIVSITVVLSVLAAAFVGFLYIFDVMSFEYATSTLLEVVAGIVLLGVVSAAIAFLMRDNDKTD